MSETDRELLVAILGYGRRAEETDLLCSRLLQRFDGLYGLLTAPRAAMMAAPRLPTVGM